MAFAFLSRVAVSLSLLSMFAASPSPAQVNTAPLAASQADQPAPEAASFSGRVRDMLIAEKFDDLDRLADKFRREHTRTRGGEFKLRELYVALDAPERTDQDTLDHLAHLRKWVAQRPESITARLALATSLHRWAWVARGNGETNTVTPEGWRLFDQRHKESLAVLESTRSMPVQDPQYFLQMMAVGVAQGWDASRMKDLMDRGLQIEPEYFYLQRNYANFLLPKWYGEPGQAAQFTREAADKLGGERGDMLYFEIAGVLIRRGDGNFPVKQLDWERIQRGFHALTTQYGSTRGLQNQLAFMAWKYNDIGVARTQFATIGDDWARGVWRDRAFFDRIRDWARGANS